MNKTTTTLKALQSKTQITKPASITSNDAGLPDGQSIANVLAYSRALSVKKSSLINNIEVVLN